MAVRMIGLVFIIVGISGFMLALRLHEVGGYVVSGLVIAGGAFAVFRKSNT